MMSEQQYAQVEVRLEQMKPLGEDAGKEGVHSEEQAPASSPGAADPPRLSEACSNNASRSSVHSHKSRPGKMGKDKNTCGSSDPSIYGSLVSVHAKRNVNRAQQERALEIKGNGKILQGKLETNGNYVNNQASKNNQEARREEALKLARKRRPVTVDTAKAKTSLEALKLSIKQLKWKEVSGCYLFACCASFFSFSSPCVRTPEAVHSWFPASSCPEKREKANCLPRAIHVLHPSR